MHVQIASHIPPLQKHSLLDIQKLYEDWSVSFLIYSKLNKTGCTKITWLEERGSGGNQTTPYHVSQVAGNLLVKIGLLLD